MKEYKPVWWLRNGHINTIASALFRKVEDVDYVRERLELPDGDFLDLDWSSRNGKSRKLLIVLHGLEGNSQRPYVLGMVRHFNRNGWDAMGMNFRGCSGELNRLPQSYHMSKIDDLETVLHTINERGDYDAIALVGFSLGGSVVLNYLGKRAAFLPPIVKVGIAISVPVDLVPSVAEIASLKNRLYVLRFLNTLNPKMEEKMRQYPDNMPHPPKMPRTLQEFDDWFTAPIHGFENAMDYWTKSAPLQYLPNINRPCLLINARDDSFLSEGCFPEYMTQHNEYFHLLTPDYGGHCGFLGKTETAGVLWSEERTLEFAQSNSGG